jgi:hypothetical protein
MLSKAQAGLEHGQNVFFLHDEVILAIQSDFGAGPLAVQYLVAYFYLGLDDSAVVRRFAVAYGYYFAALGLLLGSVGDDDARFGGGFGGGGLDDYAVS